MPVIKLLPLLGNQYMLYNELHKNIFAYVSYLHMHLVHVHWHFSLIYDAFHIILISIYILLQIKHYFH